MMQKCDIRKIHFVKKSILKMASTNWNYRKKLPLMERSWLGAESMMQKCDTKEFYLVKKVF